MVKFWKKKKQEPKTVESTFEECLEEAMKNNKNNCYDPQVINKMLETATSIMQHSYIVMFVKRPSEEFTKLELLVKKQVETDNFAQLKELFILYKMNWPEIATAAFQKMKTLAKTFREYVQCYKICEEYSEPNKLFLEGMQRTAQTFEELYELYEHLPTKVAKKETMKEMSRTAQTNHQVAKMNFLIHCQMTK